MKLLAWGWVIGIGAVVAAAASLGTFGKVAPPAAQGTAAEGVPRRPDGQPDLNGVWSERFDGTDTLGGTIDEKGSVDAVLRSRTGGLLALEIDGSVMARGNRIRPMYKPEYWEKVRDLRRRALEEDPEFSCRPWGVPRIGQPQQIVQQENQLVFLYSGWPSISNVYRVVPLNRPHNPDRVSQQTSRGDSVGHWDGDTLVVDTIGFDDETWLTSRLGYFHSTELHVIERFTRAGDKIKYDVTVEDPEVLLEPWVWAPRTMTLNRKPDAMLPEDFPCSEKDAGFTKLP